MLLPVLASAQVQYVKDTTQVEAPLQSVAKTGTMRYDVLRMPAATSTNAGHMTAEQAALLNNSIAVINSINGIVNMQGQQIVDLQNEISVINLSAVVDVYDNSYTLKESDNGKTLFIHVTCTVQCPDLSAGFTCRIIRWGTGEVRVSGAKSPSGLNRINGQFRTAHVYYRTTTDRAVTGELTR